MTQESIDVRAGDRTHTFETGRILTIGRDPASDVVIDSPHVSRAHGELHHEGETWEYVDVGSTQGTYRDGVRVERVAIDGVVELVLGQPRRGETVTLQAQAAATPPTDHDRTVAADAQVTEPGGGPARPGGPLREEALVGATQIVDDGLRLECAGRSHEFTSDTQIVVGRDPDCDVVSANPNVSRRHVSISHDATGWVLRDLGSTGGTFLDGRRVETVPVQGSIVVWLGDEEAGERLVLLTSGTRQRSVGERARRSLRSGKALVAVGVVALLAIVVSLVAVLWGGGSGTSGPSVNELARATVFLDMGFGTGSGTVIDAERGLILTNAHVAAPSAPGLSLLYGDVEEDLLEDPESILISVAPGLDRAAEVRFIGRTVVVDGYLDLAIVRIERLSSGAFIEKGDLDGLAEARIGKSADLKSGDLIRVIGYPGIAKSDAPQLTEGVIEGPVRDGRIGDNRAILNVGADINPGNSGGSAYDSRGRLVGVPTMTASSITSTSLSKVDRIRPVDLAAPLIEAAQKGSVYESPFVLPLAGSEVFTRVGLLRGPEQFGFNQGCTGTTYTPVSGNTAVSVEVAYSKFTAAANQDFLVEVFSKSPTTGRRTPVGRVSSLSAHPFAVGETGCFTVVVPLVNADGTRAALQRGTIEVDVRAGPTYRLLESRSFSVGG